MPWPVRVEESVEIERSPADVWEAIADYSLDVKWRGGLVEMTPDPRGPPAIGTRVHEVVKFAGRENVADATVREVEPGVSYRFEGEGSSGAIEGGRTVQRGRNPQSAVFIYEIELRPKLLLRPLRLLLGPIIRSGLKKDLKRLKALLESN